MASMSLQVPDGRLVQKKIVRLVANDVGIRGCVHDCIDECLEIVGCWNYTNLGDILAISKRELGEKACSENMSVGIASHRLQSSALDSDALQYFS